jgi:UDP-N-acetyl-D-galactosamine dehydrogenase
MQMVLHRMMETRVAVVGLGYVGLPVALAMARRFEGTIGFDIDPKRVSELRQAVDRTREVGANELSKSTLCVTDDPELLRQATFFIVSVPTPIDAQHRPDLRLLLSATETVARALRPNSIVVFESTVYPGVVENVCGPLLARVSGLRRGVDFKLGYSPERINPGDKRHTFETITKVVSGEDAETLAKVAEVYGAVVTAGVHKAQSIQVAEAAKVIENVQRDINIALMNELALILDRIGLRTKDVLDAASTKWNFLRFEPGLVGGHCIGVDPYYLTALAEQTGYHPQVILAGRRVNESVAGFVAQRIVKLLLARRFPIREARVGVLGITFKQDVPDLRNSKVIDLITELRQYGIEPRVHDPLANPKEALAEHRLELSAASELGQLHALVLAVPHREFLELPREQLFAQLVEGGIFLDIKSVIPPGDVPAGVTYWSL